jgi:hypothetical protein
MIPRTMSAGAYTPKGPTDIMTYARYTFFFSPLQSTFTIHVAIRQDRHSVGVNQQYNFSHATQFIIYRRCRLPNKQNPQKKSWSFLVLVFYFWVTDSFILHSSIFIDFASWLISLVASWAAGFFLILFFLFVYMLSGP